MLEGICASVPRPCAFYSVIAVWDAVPWYPDSSLLPALCDILPGENRQEDVAPGESAGDLRRYPRCVLSAFAYARS